MPPPLQSQHVTVSVEEFRTDDMVDAQVENYCRISGRRRGKFGKEWKYVYTMFHSVSVEGDWRPADSESDT
jgi:hypothetical protein